MSGLTTRRVLMPALALAASGLMLAACAQEPSASSTTATATGQPARTPMSRRHVVPLFPQSLQLQRSLHGPFGGTLRWAATPGAWRDVPWEDSGLLRCLAKELASPQRG